MILELLMRDGFDPTGSTTVIDKNFTRQKKF
jgi:hypothetical protein